jgi:hypothetical protein
MHQSSILIYVFAGLLLSLANASAQEMTKLNALVTGMPQGEKQQIRVPPSNPATRLCSILTVS